MHTDQLVSQSGTSHSSPHIITGHFGGEPFQAERCTRTKRKNTHLQLTVPQLTACLCTGCIIKLACSKDRQMINWPTHSLITLTNWLDNKTIAVVHSGYGHCLNVTICDTTVQHKRYQNCLQSEQQTVTTQG